MQGDVDLESMTQGDGGQSWVDLVDKVWEQQLLHCSLLIQVVRQVQPG